MSSLDSLDNAKHSLNKFIGPVITIIVGLYLFSKTIIPVEVIQPNPNGEDFVHKVVQEPMFGYAGLFFILVGAVWLLYIFNILKSIVGISVVTILTALSVFILNKDYSIVKEDVEYQNKKDKYQREIKGRISDVKIAEIEFKKENGVYTNNANALIDFVKNGKTISYDRSGVTPPRAITTDERTFLYGKNDNRALDNNMSDIQAKAISKWVDSPDSTKTEFSGYKRDTVYVSVLETVFHSNSYKESRNKNLELEFHPDSLKFIPYSGQLITLDTASITRGELFIPTLLIQVIHPAFLKDTLQVGDLESNSLKDNWSLK
jgi:hypothetical protein